MAADPTVAIFARVPRLGHVKTRLAASLGEEVALQTHRDLLHRTLQVAIETKELNFELWLAGDPADLDSSVPAFEIHQQPAGDLGERMLAAFRHLTRRGRPALLIGSDCPLMSRNYLLQAASMLAKHDMVLGPAEDGGYVLIGLRRAVPELFLDMTWSTPSVADKTLRRAATLELDVGVLNTVWDVDTESDWKRWQRLSD